MARLARIVVVNVPHHVTQRGNARQFLLASDAERIVYLDLVREYFKLHPLSLLGYCLMSNHVHLVIVPRETDAIARALKQTHGRYASYWNAAHKSTGHVWQGRFYSCPLDSAHLWAALRYTELNPVRAELVAKAESWSWSSAAAHCGVSEPDSCLDMEIWNQHWSSGSWREYLAFQESAAEIAFFVHLAGKMGNVPSVPVSQMASELGTWATAQSARKKSARKGRRGRILGRSDDTSLCFDVVLVMWLGHNDRH